MSGVGGLAIPVYLASIKNESATAAKAEKASPTVEAAVAHFQTVAPSIKTPQALLKDYRSLTVVLGSLGMSSMIGQTAVLQKLMTQDPTSATSLAKTSGNAAWQNFAKLMSGWTSTSTPLSSTTVRSTIAQNFITSSYEASQNNQYPGIGNALYFTRAATSITSVNALMSDSTLLKVVETNLGLDPDQFGALDYDQQKTILTKDVNLKNFATPQGVQRQAEQYLALTGENGTTAAAPSGILSLFASSSDSDSLMGIIGASLSTSA